MNCSIMGEIHTDIKPVSSLKHKFNNLIHSLSLGDQSYGCPITQIRKYMTTNTEFLPTEDRYHCLTLWCIRLYVQKRDQQIWAKKKHKIDTSLCNLQLFANEVWFIEKSSFKV